MSMYSVLRELQSISQTVCEMPCYYAIAPGRSRAVRQSLLFLSQFHWHQVTKGEKITVDCGLGCSVWTRQPLEVPSNQHF